MFWRCHVLTINSQVEAELAHDSSHGSMAARDAPQEDKAGSAAVASQSLDSDTKSSKGGFMAKCRSFAHMLLLLVTSPHYSISLV
jgi:hypothetical protein